MRYLLTFLVAVMALGVPLQAASSDAQWKGAAFEGDRASLARLAAAGAKVVRVYRQSDAWVLDEAQRLGLKVVMGLWLEHPRHGFDYADARAVRAQEDAVLDFVARYQIGRAHV